MKPGFSNRFLFLPVACLTLFSCSDNDQIQYVQGTTSNTADIAVPQALNRASLSSNRLRAYLTVDRDNGGERQEMQISGGVASFEGDLAPGNRNLFLEIFYESSEFSNPVPLVNGSTVGVIAQNTQTTISFQEKDYQYFNSDSDRFTNIRELETGSDPFDGNSVPSDLDDNFEDNDSEADAYDITGLEDDTLGVDENSTMGVGFLVAENGIVDGEDYYTITPPNNIEELQLLVVANLNTWVLFYYYDDNGNRVVFDNQEVLDTIDDPDFGGSIFSFNNPPPGKQFYVYIFSDADNDINNTFGDFVSQVYTLGWSAVR